MLGPLLEVARSKKRTPLWREAHLEVKMYKAHHSRTIFGSWDVGKVHAVVARSTFPSQKYQKLTFPEHFWKLACRKSARRCGAKNISKSKVQKTAGGGARGCAPCQKWASREGFVAVSTTTPTTLHSTTLHYNYNSNYSYNHATLHYTNHNYNYNYTYVH